MAAAGPEVSPQAHKPAWSWQGAQCGARDGTGWRVAAWRHSAPASQWLGSSEGKLRSSCIAYWCIFGIRVRANAAGKMEGLENLTPCSPSAADSEAGRAAVWIQSHRVDNGLRVFLFRSVFYVILYVSAKKNKSSKCLKVEILLQMARLDNICCQSCRWMCS